MKSEELWRTNYRSEKELRKSIAQYVTFYNSERPHSAVRSMSPDKFEALYYKYHQSKNVHEGSNPAFL